LKKIAIIPARGGSKRIPRKNIKDFLGKPIIAYSIEAALECKLFDEVMVSTDDEEIAEISRHYGANVPFMRSAKGADDYATLADVLAEVLDNYKSKFNYQPEFFATILSTAPFLKKEILIEGFSKVANRQIDSIMSVGKYSTPIFRSLSIDNLGNLMKNFPEYTSCRSQDLPDAFYDAGQFYITRTESFKREMVLSCGICQPVLLPNNCIQDIDTLEDWEEAEVKYKVYFNE
jgi:pseudaminic acid cytidylyltransferase